MAPSRGRLRWQSSIGLQTIKTIVRKRIPQWENGLYDWQLEIVAKILDGEDVLVVTATGDGKSAIFGVPILIFLELAQNPFYYPDLPHPEKPSGIVITPTKGLSTNIVRIQVSGTIHPFSDASSRYMSSHSWVSKPLLTTVTR